MEIKNKTIDIFGSKYKIKFVDKVIDDNGDWLWGQVNPVTKEIHVSTILSNGKPVQQEELEISLYHELVHSMLMAGQYYSYNDNEPLVEWIARCIYTLRKQGLWNH